MALHTEVPFLAAAAGDLLRHLFFHRIKLLVFLFVFVIQLRLTITQFNFSALNKNSFDLGTNILRIAISHKETGEFAGLQ